MKTIIGIDFGTYRTRVAVMQSDVPVVIPAKNGDLFFPSVVAFPSESEFVVGEPATKFPYPEKIDCAKGISRWWDSWGDSSVKKEEQPFLFEATGRTSIGGRPSFLGGPYVKVHGKTFTPVKVISLILEEAREMAQTFLEKDIEEAVITIPHSFSHNRRDDLIKAGKMAGFQKIYTVYDYLAAGIAFAYENPNQKITLGTIDEGYAGYEQSVQQIENGKVVVKKITGVNKPTIRTNNWALADWIKGKIKDRHGVDIKDDINALRRIHEAIEEAKIALSSHEEVEIKLPGLTATEDGIEVDFNETLMRGKSEEIESPFRLFNKLGLKNYFVDQKLDKLLLLGGETQRPHMREDIASSVSYGYLQDTYDEGYLAKGAALKGAMISRVINNLKVQDILPYTLGIETSGNTMAWVMNEKTPIPAAQTVKLKNTVDNQEKVSLIIRKGNSNEADKNENVGEIIFGNITPAPAGEAGIEVTFEVDENRILSVVAKDVLSGESERITFASTSGSDSRNPPLQKSREKDGLTKIREKEGILTQKDFTPSVEEQPELILQGKLPPKAGNGIFISYRRDDSKDTTVHIYHYLENYFGKENVFFDVDSIPIGVDFRDHLDKMVSQCAIMLAIVGPNWVGREGEKRRIDDKKDFVRYEIEAAMKRDIPIVPVFIKGATGMSKEPLPKSLEDFSFRNGMPVRSGYDFYRDLKKLQKGIKKAVPKLKK
ncbi:Hsp70 family protein [bacterium]|nr:Hsp70 family protein [bacterium]